MVRAAFRQFLLVGLLALGFSNFAAATTLVYLSGSAADPITDGNTYSYLGSEGFFTPYWSSDGYVHMRFDTNDDSHYWYFTVGGPIVGNTFTGPLQTNVHYDVDPSWQMSNYGSANFGFSGDHETYGTVTGGFTLYDLVIENNVLQSFAMQFDFLNAQISEQWVRGYVWMNSDVALPPDFPGHLSVPEPGTLSLMLFGLLGAGVMKRRRKV
jgi:hypothetical protein